MKFKSYCARGLVDVTLLPLICKFMGTQKQLNDQEGLVPTLYYLLTKH